MASERDLDEIEQLLRQGAIAGARGRLRKLPLGKIPPRLRARAAGLLRRGDLPEAAIRLLNPVVRGPRAKASPPTPAEVVEYAATLTRIGAYRESADLLSSVDAAKVPRALFFSALALFARWDYVSSIPHLMRYLESDLLPYDRLVGRVNLVAALIGSQDTDRARPELERAKSEADELGAVRLAANLSELESQFGIATGNYALARVALQEARHRLASAGGLDELLIRKWETIIEVRLHPRSARALEGLKGVRVEALRQRHWETVRDLDLHLALAIEDGALLDHVYCGTPSDGFRQRLLKNAPEGWAPSRTFKRTFRGASTPLLDLTGGTEKKGRRIEQALLASLATALSSDFYAPFRGPTLFSLLHPEEHFNPQTSPGRVRQLIHRLEGTLVKLGIPLAVGNESQSYGWSPKKPCGVLTAAEPEHSKPGSAALARLEERFGSTSFSSAAAARALSVSKSMANRLLGDAVSEGRVAADGHGPARTYRFL